MQPTDDNDARRLLDDLAPENLETILGLASEHSTTGPAVLAAILNHYGVSSTAAAEAVEP